MIIFIVCWLLLLTIVVGLCLWFLFDDKKLQDAEIKNIADTVKVDLTARRNATKKLINVLEDACLSDLVDDKLIEPFEPVEMRSGYVDSQQDFSISASEYKIKTTKSKAMKSKPDKSKQRPKAPKTGTKRPKNRPNNRSK